MTRAKREWVIFNALETAGRALTIRELGAATNMDHTTLHAHLSAMRRDKVIEREAIEPRPRFGGLHRYSIARKDAA